MLTNTHCARLEVLNIIQTLLHLRLGLQPYLQRTLDYFCESQAIVGFSGQGKSSFDDQWIVLAVSQRILLQNSNSSKFIWLEEAWQHTTAKYYVGGVGFECPFQSYLV